VFSERTLGPSVSGVRDEHAPDALVLDCERDFETLPPDGREALAVVTEAIDPLGYEESWVPADAPELLRRLVGPDLIIGTPGDGSVAWTRQTDPPLVLVKPRVEGSPEPFVEFLLAEALVEVGHGFPEGFLGFFRETYPEFAAALDADPATVYQVAHACYRAYVGRHTRPVFSAWADEHPGLHDAWADAGERLAPRLGSLGADVSSGGTAFGDAAELACSGVKHGLDVPTPFDALDDPAFEEHGAGFAVAWAKRL
jgi:hypothetical protein